MSYFTPQFETIDVNSEKTWKKGFYMWFLLFLGYFLFVSSWFVMGKLKGDDDRGWFKELGVKDFKEKDLISQMVGYSIMVGRGIAFLSAAWVLKQFTHRYSVLIALFLNTFAFLLVVITWGFAKTKDAQVGYWLFVIGRLFMAFGGSLIIIYVQPIINNFIFGTRKKVLSILSSCAYPAASIILNLVFLNTEATKWFQTHWQYTALVFGALTYIPLILYFVIGIHFDTNAEKSNISEQRSYFKEVFTSKEDWYSIIFYSFLIFISVAVSWEFPAIAEDINKALVADFGDSSNWWAMKWGSIYLTCFYCGCGSGMTLGWFTTRKMKRGTVLKGATLMVCLFVSIIAICVNIHSSTYRVLISVIMFISVYFVSFFGMGLQAVFFYMPYERKNRNVERITTFFSILWGAGYLIYLGYVIILDLLRVKAGGKWALLLLFFIIQLYFLCSFLIKETRNNWPTFSLQAITESDEKYEELDENESKESLVTTEIVETTRRN